MALTMTRDLYRAQYLHLCGIAATAGLHGYDIDRLRIVNSVQPFRRHPHLSTGITTL